MKWKSTKNVLNLIDMWEKICNTNVFDAMVSALLQPAMCSLFFSHPFRRASAAIHYDSELRRLRLHHFRQNMGETLLINSSFMLLSLLKAICLEIKRIAGINATLSISYGLKCTDLFAIGIKVSFLGFICAFSIVVSDTVKLMRCLESLLFIQSADEFTFERNLDVIVHGQSGWGLAFYIAVPKYPIKCTIYSFTGFCELDMAGQSPVLRIKNSTNFELFPDLPTVYDSRLTISTFPTFLKNPLHPSSIESSILPHSESRPEPVWKAGSDLFELVRG